MALARALAIKPQVLLLDEPLSALDAKIRVSLREEIRALQRKLGITTIFVTHDQEEALSMSDRIVVDERRPHRAGRHAVRDLQSTRRRRFVASFVGTLSVLNGRVVDAAAGVLEVGGQKIVAGRGFPNTKAGEDCSVSLRPEAARLEIDTGQGAVGSDRNCLRGTIEDVSFLGSVVRIKVRLGDNLLSLDTFNNPGVTPPARGTAATVTFSPADLLVLEAA